MYRDSYHECATIVATWELKKGRTTKQVDAFLKRCGYLWIRRDAIKEARRRLRAKRAKLDADLKLKSRGRATPKEPQEPSDGERCTAATGADAAVLA
jgi:hypothetical protein